MYDSDDEMLQQALMASMMEASGLVGLQCAVRLLRCGRPDLNADMRFRAADRRPVTPTRRATADRRLPALPCPAGPARGSPTYAAAR